MISIIVPIYNLEDKLKNCLDSICRQYFKDLEILLLDDGSTDHSLDICKEFENIDNRIRVFSHSNHGVSFTRNRGIDESTGEYIMFIDGDDKIAPDYVLQYAKCIQNTASDIVIGGMEFIQNDKKENRVFNDAELSRTALLETICQDKSGLFGYVPNKLYRSSIVKEHNIRFNENMIAQEDLDFALSVYSFVNKVSLLSYVGYSYYHTEGKRHIAAESIIGNQIKLLEIAKNNNVNVDICSMQIKKIYGMIFTSLYWAENNEKIRYYRTIWDDFIKSNSPKDVSFKVKVIISLFKNKQYCILYRTFYLWKVVTKK